MSRLDSFIRRMCAQRDILDALATELGGIEGAIYEFGLGSGRTFDHLRERFPNRRIVVFERDPSEDCMPEPPPDEFILGNIRETSIDFPDGGAALVHADINTGHPQGDAELVAWLSPLVARLLTPNGIAVSSVSLDHSSLMPLPLPNGVPADRYFLARRIS